MPDTLTNDYAQNMQRYEQYIAEHRQNIENEKAQIERILNAMRMQHKNYINQSGGYNIASALPAIMVFGEHSEGLVWLRDYLKKHWARSGVYASANRHTRTREWILDFCAKAAKSPEHTIDAINHIIQEYQHASAPYNPIQRSRASFYWGANDSSDTCAFQFCLRPLDIEDVNNWVLAYNGKNTWAVGTEYSNNAIATLMGSQPLVIGSLDECVRYLIKSPQFD